MSKDRFCSICEGRLTKKDSEHVCRLCFRKAREKKTVEVHLSDSAADRLGTAFALGSFINWGLQRLVEASGTKLAPPPKTTEEMEKINRDAKERLREIQKRVRKHRPRSRG